MKIEFKEKIQIQEQREALNIAFALDPYPSGSAIDYLANEINAEVKSIVKSSIIFIITVITIPININIFITITITITINISIITIIIIIITIILISTGKVHHQLVPQPSNEAQTDPRGARYVQFVCVCFFMFFGQFCRFGWLLCWIKLLISCRCINFFKYFKQIISFFQWKTFWPLEREARPLNRPSLSSSFTIGSLNCKLVARYWC